MNNQDNTAKEQRRQDLLNAASELLMQTPTASLAEIATYAKVGKATLHRYFPGRDDLMLALGYRTLAQVSNAILESRLNEGSITEALGRLTEALVPLGDKWHFLLTEPILDTHPHFVEADTLTQRPILALIQRGQANGELRADLSAEWLLHMMNFALYATWECVFDGSLARKDAGRLLMTTLLGGIAPR